VAFAASDALGGGQIHRLGERHAGAAAQEIHAGSGEFERGVFAFGHADVTESHQFATNGGPLGTIEFFADAVGGQTIMGPTADFLRVGADQDLDDVVESDVEA